MVLGSYFSGFGKEIYAFEISHLAIVLGEIANDLLKNELLREKKRKLKRPNEILPSDFLWEIVNKVNSGTFSRKGDLLKMLLLVSQTSLSVLRPWRGVTLCRSDAPCVCAFFF